MTNIEIIEENKRRLSVINSVYNPYTGEGSTSIERKKVHIDGFPLEDMYLPTEFADSGFVQKLSEVGYEGYIKFILCTGVTQELKSELWIEFCKERIKYDFEFWAALLIVIALKGLGRDSNFVLNRAQRHYLKELEKLRFSNPFEYDIRVEEGIDPETTLIPPLILQPFVENALKHGFRDETKRGMLSITIIKENDFLCCTVEDNGVGRMNSISHIPVSGFKKESLGLKITEERLNLISESRKQRAYFKIEDLLDKSDNPLGTRVLVFLPYEQSI